MSVAENLSWRPGCDRIALSRRAGMLACIREYFAQENVLEVETPALSSSANSDPNIESFAVSGSNGTQYFLHTSPEFPMKRLLASGSGDIYQICKVFRDEEKGRYHNPEFSMLEWYRVGWNEERLYREVTTLVERILVIAARKCYPQVLSYADLFQQQLDIDPHRTDTRSLGNTAAQAGLESTGLERDQILDFLLSCVLLPARPEHELLVLTGYPASQCALAQLTESDLPLARRFEVYYGGIELANGYLELTCADELRHRFDRELAARQDAKKAVRPLDKKFLAAHKSGLPDCAGVALGLDRLLMCASAAGSISEVLAFDIERA